VSVDPEAPNDLGIAITLSSVAPRPAVAAGSNDES
jgi:hypothetical protein